MDNSWLHKLFGIYVKWAKSEVKAFTEGDLPLKENPSFTKETETEKGNLHQVAVN